MDQITQDRRRLEDLKRTKLQMPPFDPEVCYEVGVIHERLGEQTQAAQWFARTLKYDPNHQKALKIAVKYLEQMGDKDTAKDLKARIRRTEEEPPVFSASMIGLLSAPFGQGPLLGTSALIAGSTGK